MNLAEIRKKARAEKDGGTSVPPTGGGRAEQPLSPREGVQVPTFSDTPHDTRGTGETVPMPPPPPVVTRQGEGVSPPPPAAAPRGFDPVRIILRGRELAEQVVDPELVAEKSQLLAEEAVTEYLCFRVGTELYAVPIMTIKEIIKPRELTEVPRSPSFVKGILSLRGVIIPIFSLRERLHFEPAPIDGRSRIVVVRKGDELCGILVDEVLQVAHLADDSIEPPPSVLDGIDRDFVSGIGRHGGRMIIVLSLANLLDMQRL